MLICYVYIYVYITFNTHLCREIENSDYFPFPVGRCQKPAAEFVKLPTFCDEKHRLHQSYPHCFRCSAAHPKCSAIIMTFTDCRL